MAKGIYVGVDGKARKVKKIYAGVGGVARKVKKGYIGVGGVARPFFSGGELTYFGVIDYKMQKSREKKATSDDKYVMFATLDYSLTDTESYVFMVDANLNVQKISDSRADRTGASVGTVGKNKWYFFGREGSTVTRNGVYYDENLTSHYEQSVDWNTARTRTSAACAGFDTFLAGVGGYNDGSWRPWVTIINSDSTIDSLRNTTSTPVDQLSGGSMENALCFSFDGENVTHIIEPNKTIRHIAGSPHYIGSDYAPAGAASFKDKIVFLVQYGPTNATSYMDVIDKNLVWTTLDVPFLKSGDAYNIAAVGENVVYRYDYDKTSIYYADKENLVFQTMTIPEISVGGPAGVIKNEESTAIWQVDNPQPYPDNYPVFDVLKIL